MTLPPHAPWALDGQGVVALARWRGDGCRPPLPAGLRRLPGPYLIGGAHWGDSPVGPYRQFAVGRPALLGARVGLCLTTSVVTSSEARVGGRVNWGYPKELGTLLWSATGDGCEMTWEEQGVLLRARVKGPPLPVLVPVPSVQRRTDGPVVVPGRVRAWARPARVTLKVPGDVERLAGLDGNHPGLVLSGLHLVVRPARHPSGFRATLLAPLRAPEPALSSRD